MGNCTFMSTLSSHSIDAVSSAPNPCPAQKCLDPTCPNTTGKTTERYKALIKVRDKTATIRLTLFDTFRSFFGNFLCRALSHSKEGGSARVDQIPKTVIDEVYKFRIKVNSANYTNIQSGSYSVQAIEWVPRAFNAGPAAYYNHPKVHEGPAAYCTHPKEQIKLQDQGTDFEI